MSNFAISHSMADAYMSCQKKFEYAHIKKLMPVKMPEALARGTWGHKVLELFFINIKSGETVEKAKSVALLNAADNPTYFGKMWPRIEHFLDNIYPTLGWEEILAVESTERIPVGSAYDFPFTVDLVVRLKEDQSVMAVDFKFGADAYSDELCDLYPQLPKYVGGMQFLAASKQLGFDPPSRAMYVFIRSRANIANPDLFIETRNVKVPTVRIRNSFAEQDKASKAILAHMADDARPYPRTFNNNCKFCPFLELCIADINGREQSELETMEKVLYTTNTYGYDLEEIT